jgi:antitoxin HicB
MRYAYPARMVKRPDTILVGFRGLPEAITEGATREEALEAAEDCLDTALYHRLKVGQDIPEPSEAKRGEVMVRVRPETAAKIALAVAFRQSGMSRLAFGRKIGRDEKVVRRLLDPDHVSKLEHIDAALRALGRRLVLSDEAA